MAATEIDSIYSRLRALEAEHRKAEHYRDRWAKKAERAKEKLDAFRLVCEDLDLEPPQQRRSAEGSADGLTAAIRAAVVSRFAIGTVITPDDVRPHLGEFQDMRTHLITKALVRMTEEEDFPPLALEETGRGQRQSRYRVLVSEVVTNEGGGTEEDDDAFRQSS